MDSAPLQDGSVRPLGDLKVHAGRIVAGLVGNDRAFGCTKLDRHVVETRLPRRHRPHDARLRLPLDFDRARIRVGSVPHEDAVLPAARGFAAVEPEANAPVLVELGLGAEHLAFFRSEIGRPVSIELYVGTEVDQLELVQPSGVHFDVQAKQDVERRFALDLDGRACAVNHRAGPSARGRRSPQSRGGDEEEQADGGSEAHGSNLRNSRLCVKFPTACGSTTA